jgi:hypothetical protein
MKKIATFEGLTLSLDGDGNLVVDGEASRVAETRLEKGAPQWKMTFRFKFVSVVFANVLEVLLAGLVVKAQGAWRRMKEQKAIDAMLKTLPMEGDLPVYVVSFEAAGKNPGEKDPILALVSKTKSLDKDQRAALRALLDELEEEEENEEGNE